MCEEGREQDLTQRSTRPQLPSLLPVVFRSRCCARCSCFVGCVTPCGAASSTAHAQGPLLGPLIFACFLLPASAGLPKGFCPRSKLPRGCQTAGTWPLTARARRKSTARVAFLTHFSRASHCWHLIQHRPIETDMVSSSSEDEDILALRS